MPIQPNLTAQAGKWPPSPKEFANKRAVPDLLAKPSEYLPRKEI